MTERMERGRMIEQLLPGLSGIQNLHPLFVHFPIALWTTSAGFMLASTALGRDDLYATGRWLLYLGAGGAAMSVASGLLAADALGHDSAGHDLVHVHRDFMYVASGLGLAAAGSAFAMRRRRGALARQLPAAVLYAAVTVMLLGADRGAALVYVYGTGVNERAPAAKVGREAGHGDLDHDHGSGSHGSRRHSH